MNYAGFSNRIFRGWKGSVARAIRRLDQEPVAIDGVSFSTLEVGFAWPDPDAAIADAKPKSTASPGEA